MAALRSLPRPVLAPLSRPLPLQRATHRPFILPSLTELTSPPGPRTLRAARTLPYPLELIYAIISDIDSYSTFLPFCTSSRVHRWTSPSPAASSSSPPHRYPALATLTVGWGPFAAESYTSRVYCVPGRTVEAVSGAAGPSTSAEVLRRAGYDDVGAGSRHDGDGGLFKSLVTKWTVEPVVVADGDRQTQSQAPTRTDVSLSIDYLLANPLHQVAVGGVADQVADKMIRAFEARAEELYSSWRRKNVETRR